MTRVALEIRFIIWNPRSWALALLLTGVAALSARANVTLPALFSDHMVVQRATSIPVWGWADAGEQVSVNIAGLIPYAIRGAIWYQGESNAGRGQLYELQLTTMITDWRTGWGQGDFPFAWVQLPNFHAPQTRPVENDGWPLVREGMRKALRLPNTGMAITIDVGEVENIHPRNKQAVGQRLAMWALAKVYGQADAASGPLPAGHEVNGGSITVSFKETDGGLVAKGGDLTGFAIAGADQKWVAASAKIEREKVVVSSPDVAAPVAVRYAWAPNPNGNLYNGAGIPATPFRTDDWPAEPTPPAPQNAH